MNYDLVFAKEIAIESTPNGICVTINHNHKANFVEQSNITKLFRLNEQDCITKLTGGTFFFVDGQLVDHRDISYDGYIMSDSDISEVMSHIGVSKNISKKDLKGFHLVNSGRSDYTLLNSVKKKGMSLGHIELYQVWSPFSNNIRFSYKVVVEEGEVVFNKPLSKYKVSITSDNWQSELNTTGDMCLSKLISLFESKFISMKKEKCSVKDMTSIYEHAKLKEVYEIVENTNPEGLLETDKTNLTALQAWQYVVELIQYDFSQGDGKLYQLANNLLWTK